MLVAQPLVGAACQDSPGEQKGSKTTPWVRSNEEGDGDQQAGCETGQNSTPCDWVFKALCQAPFGVFYMKVVTEPLNNHLRSSMLFSLTYEEAEVFKKKWLRVP